MIAKKQILISIFLLLLITFFVLLFLWRFDDVNTESPEAAHTDQTFTTVAVVKVKRNNIRQWIVGEGTARSLRKEYLGFETSGKVNFIGKDKNGTHLREGSSVKGPTGKNKKGQLLASIDKREQLEILNIRQAELAIAKHSLQSAIIAASQKKRRLKLARSQLNRSQRLSENKMISKSDFELIKGEVYQSESSVQTANIQIKTAKTQIKALSAQLNQAKIDLEKTAITAPFDGVIAYLNIKLGDYFSPEMVDKSTEHAFAASAPMVIISVNQFEVLLSLPSFSANFVKQNQVAYIVWDKQNFTSEFTKKITQHKEAYAKSFVYSINPAVSSGDRTRRIRIRTNVGAENLKDGMYVNCLILTKFRENVITVPIKSQIFSKESVSVYVVDPKTNTVHRRKVTLGIEGISDVEVLSGIREGELLVVEGQKRLSENDTVRVLNLKN